MRLIKTRTSEEKAFVSQDETGRVVLYTSFEAIFLQTKDRLHHFTQKLTRNAPETKDIIQEAYTRLWEKLPTLDLSEDLLPLLLTYARNCFIDQLRKKERDDQYLYQLTGQSADIPAAAEAVLDMKDTQQQLQRSLDRLPAKRREIFSLVKEKGLSHREVAEQLGIAPATVEKQVSLSLQFLRKELNPGDA